MDKPRINEQLLLITKRGRSFKVCDTPNRSFWGKVQACEWEETTFDIIDRYVDSRVIYVDVGTWIGPTVLYAAQAADQTFAFEPDPIAHLEMGANLLLNKDADWAKRVTLSQLAIAPYSGTLAFGNRANGGDSTSSVLFAQHKTSWRVEATTLDQVFQRAGFSGRNIFLKIDIEGGEFDLVPTLRDLLVKENVVLFLSIHTTFLAASLSGGTGLVQRISRRLRLFRQHVLLCRSLPFNYCFAANGMQINLLKTLVLLLITGRFPPELLCTNVQAPSRHPTRD